MKRKVSPYTVKINSFFRLVASSSQPSEIFNEADMLDMVNVAEQEQNWLIIKTLVNIVKFESCHWTSKMKVDIYIYPRDHICRKVPQKTLNSNLPFKRRQMGYDLLRCYMVRYIEKISR